MGHDRRRWIQVSLRAALDSGEFIITSEVGPPKGTDVSEMLRAAEMLRNRVHAINVTDNQAAVMRLSTLAACVHLEQAGLDPVLQVTCRDRNRIGIQSDLLGAASLGITNVLALTGDHVADARVAFGLEPTRPSAPGISLTLDKRGGAIFTKLTGNNVGRQLAIVLDNRVKSAPVIRDKIRGGRASITGLTGDAEAKDLGIVLRAGALPTDLVLQEERTVGPTLGRDSIRQGLRAAFVGLALVILLMLIYYRASGALAVLALVLNIFFLMATLGMLRATLTLPGIAGIVLTIGIAVDANVLVFERIREELRNGKTVLGAIDAGYGRAFVTIMDSNLTTLISAIVLFQFGTGPIKGFATTIMIGIIANIFTAVFVTRLIYDSIMVKHPIEKLSI